MECDKPDIKFLGIKELNYGIPEWEDDKENGELEQYFEHNGEKYFLSEFMAVHNPVYNPNPPDWMKPFDGYDADSFFSGHLVKLFEDENGEDCVKLYLYCS